MKKIFNEISRTFNEFLLVPGYSSKECVVENVSLKTPLVKFKKNQRAKIELNIPMTSAIMQAVSGVNTAIELSKQGGISFIYCSQPIEKQVEMVKLVKEAKIEIKNDLEVLLDNKSRIVVGAGINTRDYKQRVPALIKAGIDVLCIDSSEGFSQWQAETIKWIKQKYGDEIKVGAGNIVDGDGFLFLAEAGADFIKVGIGGGSICITRATKGIGRGQATALMDVAKARDDYFKKTNEYIPICSDGGITSDYHIALALAMGADFVMLGRYFSQFKESPTKKLKINGIDVKEYWGEGSSRARNWQRYDLGNKTSQLTFEEGVDSYVPYAGTLKDNVQSTINKIKSAMCNCGSLNIKHFYENAKLTVISEASIIEGKAHSIILKNRKEQ